VPWFRIDDSFHSHPKTMVTSPAALGLWAVAGSWSSAHLTDGVVPDRVLPLLLPDAAKLARELADAGLWERQRGGYRFHDWKQYNPLKDAVEKTRENNARRQRRWQEAQANGVSNAVSNAVTNSAPTRPVSTGSSGTGRHVRAREDKQSPIDSAATRHPSNRTVAEAAVDAGLVPGHQPARGDTVTQHADAIRQTLRKDPP
jgi:hypothetical protein